MVVFDFVGWGVEGAADEEVLGRQLSLEGSSSNSPLPSWLPKVAAAAADILPSSQLSNLA